MGMIAVTTALAFAALIGAAASASATARRTCGPHSDATVTEARSRYMRVYSHQPANEITYYACLFRGGKPTLLGSGYEYSTSAGDRTLENFRFAGRFVAFTEGGCSVVGCLHRVGVADVHRRRKRTTREFDGNPVTIRLTRSGHAAFLWNEAYGPADPPDYFVAALDRRGVTELDRGPVSHLTLDGNTVRWLHAGKPRAARFAGHPRSSSARATAAR